MTEFLNIMGLPLIACFILAGMHAYLGIHVIERQIIFVDLALAQMAALGASFALMLGYSIDSLHAYGISLAFTWIGAAFFAGTRFKKHVLPQEVIIGILYAVSAAALMLLVSRSGEGDEYIKQALFGNILLVPSHEVLKLALLYIAMGLFHYQFRTQFVCISQNPTLAYQKKMKVRWWDFLFYASFGIVVTSSVKIAGVLLVFSFLVVPSAIAFIFSKRIQIRWLLGWLIGILASLLGITASYYLDLPTAASIVAIFGILFLISLCKRA